MFEGIKNVFILQTIIGEDMKRYFELPRQTAGVTETCVELQTSENVRLNLDSTSAET